MSRVRKRANCWSSFGHQNCLHRKTASNRSNFGRTSKLTDRAWRPLKRIMGRNHRTTADKVTAALNQNLNSPVLTKTLRRELNMARHHGRAALRNPLFSTFNIQRRLKRYRDHKGWSAYFRRVQFFSIPICRGSLWVEAAQGRSQPWAQSYFPQWSVEVDQLWLEQQYRSHRCPAW